MSRVVRSLTLGIVTVTMLAGPPFAAGADGGARTHPLAHEQRAQRVGPLHPVQSTIGPDSVGSGTVDLVSGVWWLDTSGYLNVAGEVFNGTSSRRQYVGVAATVRDADGVVIDTLSTYADIDQLAPGMNSSFWTLDTAPPGADSVEVAVTSGYAVSTAPKGTVAVTLGAPFTDGYGWRHYPGIIENLASFSVEFAQILLTFYDAGGDVVDADWTYADLDTIPAKGSSPFELILFDGDPGAAQIGVAAQARSEAVYSDYLTSWNNYFNDIGFLTFRPDILWLANSGITTGCGAGLFCPDDPVTRGQMAAFLDRALHLSSTATDFFTDDDGTTFEGNINRLAASGITKGCSATLFCSTDTVTRGQMAAFLDRAFHLPVTTVDSFTDDDGTTFEGNINRLAASGITKGCGPTTFCPTAEVTRGQMAAFLHRALTAFP